MQRHIPSLALCLVLLGAAAPARAVGVRLGAGADYWLAGTGAFQLTLGVETALAKRLYLGGRFGAIATTSPTVIGAPIDLTLRGVPGGRVYIEGLLGPWLFFGAGDALHAHAGLGFGLQSGAASFGVEAGYLSPSGMIGLRFGYAL